MSPTVVSHWVLIQSDSGHYNQIFCLDVGGFLWLGEAWAADICLFIVLFREERCQDYNFVLAQPSLFQSSLHGDAGTFPLERLQLRDSNKALQRESRKKG
ncbi:uncharacterized [Tachysurus ichikawai]